MLKPLTRLKALSPLLDGREGLILFHKEFIVPGHEEQ